MNILLETFRLPDKDQVQIRLTYTIDGFAVQSRLKGSRTLRHRLFDVFQEMHKVALKFVARLIFDDTIGRNSRHVITRPMLKQQHPAPKSLPVNGSGDYIDAEIVE